MEVSWHHRASELIAMSEESGSKCGQAPMHLVFIGIGQWDNRDLPRRDV